MENLRLKQFCRALLIIELNLEELKLYVGNVGSVDYTQGFTTKIVAGYEISKYVSGNYCWFKKID
jgi:hypothetical protein